VKEVKEVLAGTPQGRIRQDAPGGLKNRFYSEFFGFLKNSLFIRATRRRKRSPISWSPRRRPKSFSNKVARTTTRSWSFKPSSGCTRPTKANSLEKVESISTIKNSDLSVASNLRQAHCQRSNDAMMRSFVDEFQDINRLDFALISLVADARDNPRLRFPNRKPLKTRTGGN
jgi:DNA helicase II / ATP-dependent DNA helicase PcrA